MNQIHTSYKASKMLKDFLGESAPEPMTKEYWCMGCGQIQNYGPCEGHDYGSFPAYPLHDLLSKPFCEAFAEARGKGLDGLGAWILHKGLSAEYFKGGLTAVEAELTRMMEGK